jgi:hypothetical protein
LFALSAGAVLGTSACAAQESPAAETRDAAARPTCELIEHGIRLPRAVEETSGLVASRRHAGILWTHNDRGGDPRLYAIDTAGEMRGRLEVRGARALDWEDVAMGPCPSGDCVYIADTGSNRERRETVTIYRVPEPAPDAERTARAEAFPVRFPGGPQDTEALFVLPTGALYLVTKGESGPVELFRYPPPLRPDEVVTLERVRHVAETPRRRGEKVTGADASRDGAWVAIRTYDDLLLFRTVDLLGGGGETLRVSLDEADEAQGEAVAFGAGGSIVLTSEAGGRSRATLARLACSPRGW